MLNELPQAHKNSWSLQKSSEFLARAENSLAGITSSMMKKPEHFCPGEFPVYLRAGKGALVEDVDGNEYIDFISGLGANSLGHQHPKVVEAIQAALAQGLLHSLPTELELTVAEKIAAQAPGGEMVRFFKTGADATSAAIRLARFLSKKEEIITVGYNGWHDHFMVDTPGIPAAVVALTERLPLFVPPNEEQLLSKIAEKGDKLAAVLLSVPYNRTLSAEFMQKVEKACKDAGVFFILDEIVTGFRLGAGGAARAFGVTPDLICYSKALAAGMPLSAVVGSRALMSEMEKLQVSTTFGGELLSLAVCNAALDVYANTDYYEQIARLGVRLREGVNAASAELGCVLAVRGYDAIPMFMFGKGPEEHIPRMKVLQGLLAKRGVIVRRDVNFIGAAHTEAQIDHTIAAVKEGLQEMGEQARA